jgi:membrane associated rhomboid family serine protease
MIPIRDENPTRITPYVTWGLIAAILGVFAAQLSLGSRGAWLVADFGAVPALLLGEQAGAPPWLWATPFTALFLQAA